MKNINELLKEKRPNLKMLVHLFDYVPIPNQNDENVLILQKKDTKYFAFYSLKNDDYTAKKSVR